MRKSACGKRVGGGMVPVCTCACACRYLYVLWLGVCHSAPDRHTTREQGMDGMFDIARVQLPSSPSHCQSSRMNFQRVVFLIDRPAGIHDTTNTTITTSVCWLSIVPVRPTTLPPSCSCPCYRSLVPALSLPSLSLGSVSQVLDCVPPSPFSGS